MLARLQVGFSHLREYKFRHSFKDTLNRLCYGSIGAETISALKRTISALTFRCFSTVNDKNHIICFKMAMKRSITLKNITSTISLTKDTWRPYGRLL